MNSILFNDYVQLVYALTQECFVKTDLSLTPSKDAFVSTLELMKAESIDIIESKLFGKGFRRMQKDKLIYQIKIDLSYTQGD